jgi:nitroreductase / dihydropteridine reductase
MNNLNTQLTWRYATKRMNGNVVPQAQIDSILEAIRLTPTSYGLTPYSVIVITDKEMMKKIQAAAYMQPQVVEASHLLIFAAWADISEKNVDDYMALTASTRGMPVSALDGFKKMIMGTVSSLSPEAKVTWAAKQAYIALGIALTAAAMEQVDACPMEGFDPSKVDEILGLSAKGLKSLVLMPLGYRDVATDPSAGYKKVRRATEDLFVQM